LAGPEIICHFWPGLETTEYTSKAARRLPAANREMEATQGKSKKIILVAGPCPKFIEFIILRSYNIALSIMK
jgi:hypothetical protein